MRDKGYFKAIEQVTVSATTKQPGTVDDRGADQHTYVNKAAPEKGLFLMM